MKRHIIVTGGASGIGLAITEKFANGGDHVHVLEIDIDKARRNLDHFTAEQVSLHECDVADTVMTHGVIESIIANSRVDVLVNNAGIAHVGTVENTTEEDMDRLYSVNVKGVYNCIHAIIGHMKTQD